MPPRRTTGQKSVETLKHEAARRKNIPSAEQQSYIQKEQERYCRSRTHLGGEGDGDLQEAYDSERQLLHVAGNRACNQPLVSGVRPVSEFLDALLA